MTDRDEFRERLRDRLAGALLGTAVGDALGLPGEGLSRRRFARWHPGPLRHRFLFGRGMVSDDTEHAFMLAQSFLDAPDDPDLFGRRFASRLKRWFLALPAGVGLGTARACLKMLVGFPPAKSGVRSAGNGPAMRSALLGVLLAENVSAEPDRLRRWVSAATTLTHTDPRALTAALAVADMARLGAATPFGADPPAASALAERLASLAAEDAEWRRCVDRMDTAWTNGHEVAAFAEAMGQGQGISGYAYATVPAAIYAWRRHWGDFAATVESVIRCGGDTDTTGAVAGALAGANGGATAIPTAWLDGMRDWPVGVPLLRDAAERLSTWKLTGQSPGPAPYAGFGVLPRNVFFLLIVLAHGFRRLGPPYGGGT